MYTKTYTHTRTHTFYVAASYARENGDNEENIALGGIEREAVNSRKGLDQFRFLRLMTTEGGQARRCRTLRYYCN